MRKLILLFSIAASAFGQGGGISSFPPSGASSGGGSPAGSAGQFDFTLDATHFGATPDLSYTAAIVQPVQYFGSALNDLILVSGDTYTSVTDPDDGFVITISATGAPDHFTWQKGAGAVNGPLVITGANQSLSDGVVIKFNATTGHLLNDSWNLFTGQCLYTSAGSPTFTNGPLGKLCFSPITSDWYMLADPATASWNPGFFLVSYGSAINQIYATLDGAVGGRYGEYAINGWNGTPQNPVTVDSNALIGKYSFYAEGPSGLFPAAAIKGSVSGSPGSGSKIPSVLTFETNDGTTNHDTTFDGPSNLWAFSGQMKLLGLSTGAATGKHVVCVDPITKQFYESSTGTDCSN